MTLAVLCTSLVLITIDTTILNVAIPTLSRSLATSTGELQWIVDAYTRRVRGAAAHRAAASATGSADGACSPSAWSSSASAARRRRWPTRPAC